jgi:hypothetical protein
MIFTGRPTGRTMTPSKYPSPPTSDPYARLFCPRMTRWPPGYWTFHIHCLPTTYTSGASGGAWKAMLYTQAPQTKNPRKRMRGTTVQISSSRCDPRMRGVGAGPREFGVRRRYWTQKTARAAYTPSPTVPRMAARNQIRLSTCQASSLACSGMIADGRIIRSVR